MRDVQTDISTYDFQDGNGPVAAHRHANGGGWIANTARVQNTVYVGPEARVFGYAILKDQAIISETAEVSGYSVIKDMACVKGQAVVRGACTIADSAEISGNVVIASHIRIDGHTILDKDQCSFDIKDCQKCPALLAENYMGLHHNECLYCLEKIQGRKTAPISDSRRRTIRPWLPKDGGINENIKAEAKTPDESRH